MKLSPESSKRAEGHRPERPGPSWTPSPPCIPHPPCSPAGQTSHSGQALQEGEGALREGSRLRARHLQGGPPTPQTAWGPVARPERLMSRGWK